MVGRRSASIGADQFLIPEKAADLAGLPRTAKFSPENQDKMAIAWMISGTQRRNLAAYLNGHTDDIELALIDLAKEWASIQGPDGKGMYDDDGVNKASITPDQARAALRRARKELSGN